MAQVFDASQVFRFFDLPRELRDIIYTFAEHVTPLEKLESWEWPVSHILIDAHPTTRLLLVSKQFSTEYEAVLKFTKPVAIALCKLPYREPDLRWWETTVSFQAEQEKLRNAVRKASLMRVQVEASEWGMEEEQYVQYMMEKLRSELPEVAVELHLHISFCDWAGAAWESHRSDNAAIIRAFLAGGDTGTGNAQSGSVKRTAHLTDKLYGKPCRIGGQVLAQADYENNCSYDNAIHYSVSLSDGPYAWKGLNLHQICIGLDSNECVWAASEAWARGESTQVLAAND